MQIHVRLPVLFALLSLQPGLLTAQDQAAELGLPFSDAVRAGDLLILSGQLGNLPGNRTLARGGLTAQSRQAMEREALAVFRESRASESAPRIDHPMP